MVCDVRDSEVAWAPGTSVTSGRHGFAAVVPPAVWK